MGRCMERGGPYHQSYHPRHPEGGTVIMLTIIRRLMCFLAALKREDAIPLTSERVRMIHLLNIQAIQDARICEGVDVS